VVSLPSQGSPPELQRLMPAFPSHPKHHELDGGRQFCSSKTPASSCSNAWHPGDLVGRVAFDDLEPPGGGIPAPARRCGLARWHGPAHRDDGRRGGRRADAIGHAAVDGTRDASAQSRAFPVPHRHQGVRAAPPGSLRDLPSFCGRVSGQRHPTGAPTTPATPSTSTAPTPTRRWRRHRRRPRPRVPRSNTSIRATRVRCSRTRSSCSAACGGLGAQGQADANLGRALRQAERQQSVDADSGQQDRRRRRTHDRHRR
jgi:hypothetical protein